MVGRTVHQYTFIEKLGSGGMGDIYKAQDARLNRFVAIKVLPAGKTDDPERRRRFVQEAQAASGLNHPNIITMHDILSEGDTQFMVMEYVAGKTLLDLIPTGGLRVPQVLQYATQMADALSVAHAVGIIHRDFKPANVMVTNSGLVKVLDFGLAKLTDPMGSNPDDDTMTTASPLTMEGAIMGTVSYMSPEQAEGKKLDARSDIFSFGSVLYEMVTGRRAFRGDSGISTLSAVLRDEAKPISEIAPDVPLELEQIIVRCLRKDPDGRWQSMREVEAALTALKRQSDSGVLYRAPQSTISFPPVKPSASSPPSTTVRTTVAAKPGSSKGLLAGLAVVVLLVAAFGLWWMKRQPAQPQDNSASTTTTSPTQLPAPPTSAPQTGTPATPAQTPVTVSAPAILTNESILQMVQSKTRVDTMLTQIRSSRTNFNLSPAEEARLTQAGVPPAVLAAMRNPKSAPPAAATAVPPATGEVAPPGATVSIGVPDSLPFRISLDQDVAADAAAGLAVTFTVMDGLKVDDATVIPKGAVVTGEVTPEQGKKILGMGGKMTFRLIRVDAVDGQKLSVRATAGHGTNGPATRQFATNKSTKSKELAAAKGTEYIAYTDGKFTVAARK
jgi:serine/threonine protein kinase